MAQSSKPESENATMYALGGAQTEPPWVPEPVETSPLKYRRPERFAFSPKEPPKHVIEQSEIICQIPTEPMTRLDHFIT